MLIVKWFGLGLYWGPNMVDIFIAFSGIRGGPICEF